ncbi:MAG TPA: aconitase X, partial [Pseudomonas aeruginosa]|nr:aconitase X [Pseudomonas aeruginosa]
VPPGARTLMTNSAKYAHYAPGLVGRQVRFASLAGCVEAAVGGRAPAGLPAWLSEDC